MLTEGKVIRHNGLLNLIQLLSVIYCCLFVSSILYEFLFLHLREDQVETLLLYPVALWMTLGAGYHLELEGFTRVLWDHHALWSRNLSGSCVILWGLLGVRLGARMTLLSLLRRNDGKETLHLSTSLLPQHAWIYLVDTSSAGEYSQLVH